MRAKQFLVLGLGRFGMSIAKTLSDLKQEVLAVDVSEARVNAIAPNVTQALRLNATDEVALSSLGVDQFDAAVVSIGENMRDSILITLLLKELGAKYIIAKAKDDQHAKVLRKIGADRVVFPERDMGARVAHSIMQPNVLELMELSAEHVISEIALPQSWENHSIVQLNVRRNHGIHIIAVRHGNQLNVDPGADYVFSHGDLLVVMGKKEAVEKLGAK